MLYLAEVNEAFDLTLAEYNNLEAGDGKTVRNTHFAHISHKIVRKVQVGEDFVSGGQLADLIGASSLGKWGYARTSEYPPHESGK